MTYILDVFVIGSGGSGGTSNNETLNSGGFRIPYPFGSSFGNWDTVWFWPELSGWGWTVILSALAELVKQAQAANPETKKIFKLPSPFFSYNYLGIFIDIV